MADSLAFAKTFERLTGHFRFPANRLTISGLPTTESASCNLPTAWVRQV